MILNSGSILFREKIAEDVIISSDNVILQQCQITGSVILDGAVNALIAQNEVSGDIVANGAYNSVVLLNKANGINAEKNTNIYIVENTVAGALILKNNNYLLADENISANTISESNENFNGDNITDVDSRLQSGADLDLLPHANKELFVGMERRKAVNAPDTNGEESINEYISSHTKGGVVIVPPGAYEAPAPITLGADASGSTIYAYGAFMEMLPYGKSFVADHVKDLTVKGLVTGYAQQPCGQITLVDKLDERTFLALPYAGSIYGFGKTDTKFFSAGFNDMFKKGSLYPWGTYGGAYEIEPADDGLFKFTMWEGNHWIGCVEKGDKFVNRLVGPDKISILITNSERILFKDIFLYCHSACLAVTVAGLSRDVLFYRWYNGNEAARIIDKDTYDRYRAIEEKYGIEGEVYIDALGRYRGGTPLICSSDATHIPGCIKGVDATSCLFESMCDDGSNQRASSSRLAGVEDNGDGTSTIYYKGSVSQIYCLNFFDEKNPKPRPSMCQPFRKDDRVLIYTGTGVTFCDTKVLSDEENVEDYDFIISPPDKSPRHYYDTVKKFTVATSALNMAAIEGFDLTDNHYDMANKVLVDNLSRNSAGFTFDNVMVRNTRSRGILVKTVGATIKNCTFQNLGHTGVLLSVEFVWGESSVSQDIKVQKCLFDNVGFINKGFANKTLAPVAIKGLSSTVSEEALLYKNILIEGNRFINNQNDHAVTVNSALNVKIANNVFEESVGEYEGHSRGVIDVETAMNVEISNNTYSKYLEKIDDGISAKNFKNIFGTDITLEGDIE